MNNLKSSADRIKVQVKEVQYELNFVDCMQLVSGIKVRAVLPKGVKVVTGQIVYVEYKKDENNSFYVVTDTLLERVEAVVLKAHHLISDGVMYTSIIMKNKKTGKRMHSVIPNSARLFDQTNILITGDNVIIEMNNGDIFNINIDEQ